MSELVAITTKGEQIVLIFVTEDQVSSSPAVTVAQPTSHAVEFQWMSLIPALLAPPFRSFTDGFPNIAGIGFFCRINLHCSDDNPHGTPGVGGSNGRRPTPE
jgi:hypothetical protein